MGRSNESAKDKPNQYHSITETSLKQEVNVLYALFLLGNNHVLIPVVGWNHRLTSSRQDYKISLRFVVHLKRH